jgi:DNA-binding transcriptional LysR family regulator
MTWRPSARPPFVASVWACSRSTWWAQDLRQGTLVPLLRQFRPVPEGAIYLVYLPNRTQPSRGARAY